MNKFVVNLKKKSKVLTLKKYFCQKLTLTNQPQLIGSSRIRRDLKMDNSGYPDFVSNAIGSLRRAEMIKQVGCVRDTKYYIWTQTALNYIKHDSNIIHYWINYAQNWKEKYILILEVKELEIRNKNETV